MNKLVSSIVRSSTLFLFVISLSVVSPQKANADVSQTAVDAAAAAQIALDPLRYVTMGLNSAANAATRVANRVGASILGNINAITGMANAQIRNTINAPIRALAGIGACKGNGQISDVICNTMNSMSNLPGFLTAIGYIAGLILAITALFKLKDHVINPNNTPLSDSMKRFVAGGAFFTLPLISEATQNMLVNGSTAMNSVSAYAGFAGGGAGLDAIMVSLFMDIYAPMMNIIFVFGYFVGIILVMVGIGRIIKTSQDGPRGPAGMGTIMTFVIAGVLFSLSTIMGTFSSSMFDTNKVATFAVLATSTGDVAVDDHILAIISTVLVFMTIIGYISFMRGFFMIKDVAEGNNQASLMAGVTHIFGGALAVNLGPLMNAVQRTLGIDTLGVMFY